MGAKLKRLGEFDRKAVKFEFDGNTIEALKGDTVLTAILLQGGFLHLNEFSAEPRAGFCMMGACNDCFVYTTEGDKLRACSTPVDEDMKLLPSMPVQTWLRRQR